MGARSGAGGVPRELAQRSCPVGEHGPSWVGVDSLYHQGVSGHGTDRSGGALDTATVIVAFGGLHSLLSGHDGRRSSRSPLVGAVGQLKRGLQRQRQLWWLSLRHRRRLSHTESTVLSAELNRIVTNCCMPRRYVREEIIVSATERHLLRVLEQLLTARCPRFVKNTLKLMNKGFMTTLNSNNGLIIDALADDQPHAAIVKNFGNGDVRFAHSSGMMIDSHTKAKTGYNARCCAAVKR